jgi:hypothetical protein
MKSIPYGLSDFKRVLEEDYYYVDKTNYIPLIEEYGNFLYLIRPRRFGKSLFLNMLDFYYNKIYEKDFKLLKDCYIYKNPTKLKNSFCILKFDFSAVSTKGDVDENFSYYCNIQIKEFLDIYGFNVDFDFNIPAHSNLNKILKTLKQTHPDTKIYVLIDEYDNFMNDLLMNNKKQYNKLVSSTEAVYKEFFKLLKALTNENDSLLKKMFFTGVSPLALFDVTSGSNIGINITNKYEFNSMLGITKDEFKTLREHYNINLNQNELRVLDNWYNNYKFNKDTNESVYNTDMILYYINERKLSGKIPDNLIDINVRTDYSKLKYLVHTNNRLNGNFNVLKTLFAQNYILVDTIKDSFSSYELIKQENFISLLYYLGLVTIDNSTIQGIKLHIPNQTIRVIMAEFLNTMLVDTKTLEVDLREFHQGMIQLAINDDLSVIKHLAKILDETTSIRDLISLESDIKMFYMTYFSLNRLYASISEIELNKGYSDILLLKAPNIKDDIPNILIEFKFFKQNQNINKTLLNQTINEAKEQIKRYKQTSKFQIDKSIVVIFKGFKLLYCEWS